MGGGCAHPGVWVPPLNQRHERRRDARRHRLGDEGALALGERAERDGGGALRRQGACEGGPGRWRMSDGGWQGTAEVGARAGALRCLGGPIRRRGKRGSGERKPGAPPMARVSMTSSTAPASRAALLFSELLWVSAPSALAARCLGHK